jgi:hypothetical protein
MAARRGSVVETRVEWIKAEIVDNCEACQASFGIFRRKHHCRYCGHVFCDSCTPSQMKLPPQFGYTEPQVDRCHCSICISHFSLANLSLVSAARVQRMHTEDPGCRHWWRRPAQHRRSNVAPAAGSILSRLTSRRRNNCMTSERTAALCHAGADRRPRSSV